MSKRELAIAIMQEQGLMTTDVSDSLFIDLGGYQGLAGRLAQADSLLFTLLADMIWEG